MAESGRALFWPWVSSDVLSASWFSLAGTAESQLSEPEITCNRLAPFEEEGEWGEDLYG